MTKTKRLERDRRRIPAALSCAAAFGVMVAHPLIYHNYFFDINRFKAAAYKDAAFACLALFLLALLIFRRKEKPGFRAPDGFLAAFAALAALSTALSGDSANALTGNDGRQTGLLFVLALSAFSFIAARSRNAGRWAVTGLMISGALVSALGILNFFHVDPLGFYRKMRAKDVEAFLSTIGNVDFFGVFLALCMTPAAVLFVRADKAWQRALSGVNLLFGASAVVAARTDGALLALFGAAFALLYSAASSRKKRIRAFAGLTVLSLSLCLTGAATRVFPGQAMPVSGLRCAFLVENPHWTGAAAVLFFHLSVFVARRPKMRASAHAWRRAMIWFLVILALLTAAGFAFFSFADRETALPGVLKLLRFGDRWGSNRGGVWTRCLRLYASENPRVKLLGYGPDCLRKPLDDAFGSEIAAYCNLRFNNAHNEYIQYLLTQGALGLLSYACLVISCLRVHARRARTDVFSAAQRAGVLCGLLIAAFNVNQPITTPVFFMLLTAGASAEAETDFIPARAKR